MSSSVEDTNLLSQDLEEGGNGTGYNTLQSGKAESGAAVTSGGKGRGNPKVKPGQRKNGIWKFLDFVNIFTIFVGLNFLGLPYTVSTVGIIPAVIIMCCIVLTTYHGCSLLLVCKEKIDAQKIKDSSESLAEIERSLNLGYAVLARDAFGRTGENVVTFTVFVIHFCFCVGYIIYLGNSLESLAEDLHHSKVCSSEGLGTGNEDRSLTTTVAAVEIPNVNALVREAEKPQQKVEDSGLRNLTELLFYTYMNMSHDVELNCNFDPKDAPKFHYLVWMMSPFFILLCLPNLAFVKDMLNVLSFLTFIVVYLSMSGWLVSEMFEETYQPSYKLFLAEGLLFTFGQASSTLEGMASITEAYDEMHDDPRNVKFYVAKTFLIALPAYLMLGVMGYMVLGNDVEQIITQNLPPNERLSLLVNFMVVFMILINYPNMAFPGQKILDRWCFDILTSTCWSNRATLTGDYGEEYAARKKQHRFASRLSKVISRVSFVVCTIALSTLFQNYFIYIAAFTGALDNCLLSLIFPAAIHTKVMMQELSVGAKIKNALLMVLGVCLACVSVLSFSLVQNNAIAISPDRYT